MRHFEMHPDFKLFGEKESSINTGVEFPKNLIKLVPDESGTYLVKAWHYLRNSQLLKNPTEKSFENIIDKSPNLPAYFLQKQPMLLS